MACLPFEYISTGRARDFKSDFPEDVRVLPAILRSHVALDRIGERDRSRTRLSFYSSTGDTGWSEVGHYSDRRVLSPRVARSGGGGT